MSEEKKRGVFKPVDKSLYSVEITDNFEEYEEQPKQHPQKQQKQQVNWRVLHYKEEKN